jgi:3-oxoacyl-[acyl-carrier-protein] synthase I
MTPISIVAAGMVTGVGLNAPSSCAAIRCSIDNFSETRFMDRGGEWIIGSQVLLEQPWRGVSKLVHMVVPAIRECLVVVDEVPPEQIPLLLCVAEKERPGRLSGVEGELFSALQAELSLHFHPRSTILPYGRVAGGLALQLAHELMKREQAPYCLIAGVDSYLVAGTLVEYEERKRLLTSQNSNGFIPGEAGAAVLVSLQATNNLICLGVGTGTEKATIESEEPSRANGMVRAVRTAFEDADFSMADVDYRVTDCNGEQYLFKEAALVVARLLRARKEEFEIWHPADCIGEVGAAIGPCAMGVALAAATKSYAPGARSLFHFSGDDGARVAMLFAASGPKVN